MLFLERRERLFGAAGLQEDRAERPIDARPVR
jgi:hypothetical protein